MDSLKISLDKFDQTTRDICASKKIGLLSSWGPDRVLNSCFRAMFMRKLLVDGYGFETDWSSKIDFVSRVQGSSVGWSKGYALYHAGIDHVTYFSSDGEKFLLMLGALVSMLIIGSALILEFPRIIALIAAMFNIFWAKCCDSSGSECRDEDTIFDYSEDENISHQES